MRTRRQFIAGSMAAGAAALSPITSTSKVRASTSFKLRYAPHFGMFEASAGADLISQLEYMADHGFTAVEDNWLEGRPVAIQERIGKTLQRLNMTMGEFPIGFADIAKVPYASGTPEVRQRFLQHCRNAVEIAKRVDARWLAVVPGIVAPELPIGIQTGNIIDILRDAADMLTPHGITMVVEAASQIPGPGWPGSIIPGFFLRTSDQAYALCRAVNSPACKLLYDTYHMQRNEGHLISHIDSVWSEIEYFQTGDVPGPFEPGTGEINFRNVLSHIHRRMRDTGRNFIFGMEHMNSKPGEAGEQALIDAYMTADAFDA